MAGPATDIQAQLERRRRAVAALWDVGDAAVLIGAGEPVRIPGRADRTYPFRAHSEYFYLTDRERPGGVLAFDPADGWLEFLTPVTRDERLWEGAHEHDDDRATIDDLAAWIERRRGKRIAVLGAPVTAVRADTELGDDLRHGLDEVRRPKDDVELTRMRAAEQATSAGFMILPSLLEPGRTERAIQIELESEFLRSGGDRLAFDTIVGSGPNSAVLHFAPSARAVQDGELVLVDAGAEVGGYVSDITRTYAVGGRFSAEQEELLGVVDAAKDAATERCVAGTEWRDVHRTASLVIAQGLVEFGLLQGDPESLVEQGAQSVFFPHGIGHMVGLGVRDAGGAARGRVIDPDAFPRLRCDLPLEEGFTMTVEPGIYIVPALLEDGGFRERYRETVNWERAEQMADFGGIRLEDNVLVTSGAPEVLTADVP